jgi:predicted amidohydrolase YtcJ
VHDFATKGIDPRGERALAEVLPGYHRDAQYRRLVRNLRDAARFGITTIVEPQNGLGDLALFSRARADGELRSRLVAAIFCTPDSPPKLLTNIVAAKAAYDDDRLRAGPVKFYIDDVIEPHTAAMLAPYANAPGQGSLYWPPEESARLIIRLEVLGLQAFVHATGDRGIRTALDGRRGCAPRAWPARRAAPGRPRRMPGPCRHSQVPRAGSHRVHAASPLRPRPGGRVAGQRRPGAGALRLGDAQPRRHRRRARLFQRLERRRDEPDDRHLHCAHPRRPARRGRMDTEETLDLGRTLRTYTYGGAYANFAEHNRGTLRAGKLADVIVLSGDLHQIPEWQLPRTTVTHTIAGGQIVHRQS